VYCVGSGSCYVLITSLEESYRQMCVCLTVFDVLATAYIPDVSTLRVTILACIRFGKVKTDGNNTAVLCLQ